MIHERAPFDLCTCGEPWPCRFNVELDDLVGLRQLRAVWGHGPHGRYDAMFEPSRKAIINLDGVTYRFIESIERADPLTARGHRDPHPLISKLEEIRVLTEEELLATELVVNLSRVDLLVEVRVLKVALDFKLANKIDLRVQRRNNQVIERPPAFPDEVILLYMIDEKTGLVVLEIGTGVSKANWPEFVFNWNPKGYTPAWLASTES